MMIWWILLTAVVSLAAGAVLGACCLAALMEKVFPPEQIEKLIKRR